ncbi:hypothetical protein EQ500_08780 [Lactobacillus sp. XV13L]|nr:hypothetical protein [Lactobacillus sp. XV13L]
MKIRNILVNQMKEPLGFELTNLRITFEVVDCDNWGEYYKGLKIGKIGSEKALYLSEQKYTNNYFDVGFKLEW